MCMHLYCWNYLMYFLQYKQCMALFSRDAIGGWRNALKFMSSSGRRLIVQRSKRKARKELFYALRCAIGNGDSWRPEFYGYHVQFANDAIWAKDKSMHIERLPLALEAHHKFWGFLQEDLRLLLTMCNLSLDPSRQETKRNRDNLFVL